LQRRRTPTRSIIPFRTNYITMHCGMLGSVFDTGTFYAGPHSLMCIPLQVPPAPGHGQPEGHREDIPPPIGGVAGPGRVQDPHRIDMAYQGIVDYRPHPLANPAYIFPDVGHAQGIQAQVQPNALVNQDVTSLAMSMWYQTLLRLPFLIHLFTVSLLPTNQDQRISDNLPVVIGITPMHRLVWSVWKRAPLVNI